MRYTYFYWIVSACTAAAVVIGWIVANARPIPLRSDSGGTPSYVVVPNTGVGNVRFGMSVDEVVELLGRPVSDVTTQEGRALDYRSQGFRMVFDSNARLYMIRCVSRLAYGDDVETFAGTLDKGIRMGDSLQSVRRAYGVPESEFGGSNGFLMYATLATRFSFRDGKLCECVLLNPNGSRRTE